VIDIELPHNGWMPRPHQMALWQYLQAGGERALAVWHRRAGKDEICLQHAAVSAMKRPGNYWHCLPEYLMARKAIWTSINAHTGRRRIDEAFPDILRENISDNEMFIRFKNGSTWQLIGSDRYDATVGWRRRCGHHLFGVGFGQSQCVGLPPPYAAGEQGLGRIYYYTSRPQPRQGAVRPRQRQ
jgi:hypothetical protein